MEHVQILIYTSYLHVIGGIETFVYNFTELMNSYEIGVYCPKLPEEIKERVEEHALLFQTGEVSCDTLIMLRMMDELPGNVIYKRSIRMCHAIKSDIFFIRDDCDELVHVSESSKRSFKTSGEVIYNPLMKQDGRALLLVSATRIPALDKGENAKRMLKLAEMLYEAEIPYLWMNFSDAPLNNAPPGFVNVGTFQDLQPYIARADYMVQLSDQEGFGYSVLEALTRNTAVICTPFETTKELAVIDGKNGYIVPFDLDFDVRKLLNVPRFTYTWNNDMIRRQWEELLSKKPKKKQLVRIKITGEYGDVVLKRRVHKGEVLYMTKDRAKLVVKMGYGEILKSK